MTESRKQTWAPAVVFVDLVDASFEAVRLLEMPRQLA
jgi:hypothetical protein